ncbi:hypothetical protein ACLQ24_18145 [Micromonospora sp. DT4]|uniref:hypothetical protein n=1 Tax=Micromonospora sp. DT4 TaxID=3393438 RepID=UPI003CF32793
MANSTVLGRWRRLSLAAGLTALVGTVLFVAQQGTGIGVGGMERVAVLPFPLWACCLGVLLAETPNRAILHFCAHIRGSPRRKATEAARSPGVEGGLAGVDLVDLLGAEGLAE